MISTSNMAVKYEAAWNRLLDQKPVGVQREIIKNPDGRSATDLSHEVAKLAEKWQYDEDQCDWDNHVPF